MKIIVAILIVLMMDFVMIAQTHYPSKESKEWNDMTVAERWKAVNIPEEKLKIMTTQELINHCLNFSFMWDIFNHPDYQSGLQSVAGLHNALRELLNRHDADAMILDYYRSVDLEKVKTYTQSIEIGQFVAQIFFLELFMSYPSVLNQFKGDEKALIKAVLKSHNRCLSINAEKDRTWYCGYSIGTKALVIGRILEQYEGSKLNNPAIDRLDLRKLTKCDYDGIIRKAREL